MHDERYTHGSAVSPSTVNDALRHGNTVLVHNLEIYWKPIGACRAMACAGRLPNVSCRRSPHARAGVFSEALSSFMNLYAQVNLYYSPPGFPGTVSLHQDAQVGGCSRACPACCALISALRPRQSVFIMQLEGTKVWNLYAPKYQLALTKVRGPWL